MSDFNLSKFIFVIILVLFECYSVLSDDQNVISVRLEKGLINGKIETIVEDKQLGVFKGIPFAEPPIGDLRFKKPIPVKEWPKTIDAYDWPNSCYQDFTIFPKEALLNTNISEDCLYMNIWTPIDSIKSDKQKAVIFYIHGGGLIFGSASWNAVVGQIISAKGDVVFVSINYRSFNIHKLIKA